MNPASPRFLPRVLEQTSQLVVVPKVSGNFDIPLTTPAIRCGHS
jgi:hypothetical protein